MGAAGWLFGMSVRRCSGCNRPLRRTATRDSLCAECKEGIYQFPSTFIVICNSCSIKYWSDQSHVCSR